MNLLKSMGEIEIYCKRFTRRGYRTVMFEHFYCIGCDYDCIFAKTILEKETEGKNDGY